MANSDANAARVMYHADENAALLQGALRDREDEVLSSVCAAGEALLAAAVQAALGSEDSKRGLETLRSELAKQQQQGAAAQSEALRDAVAAMGPRIAQQLAALLPPPTASAAPSAADSAETRQKLELLLGMVTNLQSQGAGMAAAVSRLSALTVTLEARSNRFPLTFIIVPKPPREKLKADERASRLARAGNFVNRMIAAPVAKLLWDEVLLLFVCPVSRQVVPCGPKGKGYTIR